MQLVYSMSSLKRSQTETFSFPSTRDEFISSGTSPQTDGSATVRRQRQVDMQSRHRSSKIIGRTFSHESVNISLIIANTFVTTDSYGHVAAILKIQLNAYGLPTYALPSSSRIIVVNIPNHLVTKSSSSGPIVQNKSAR